MSDKTQDASNFSFRTFDIYRRFIEVLQCKSVYLEDFKNGSPKEETCLAVIKRVFQSQQEDEEIKKYIQYFANHAKMMAGHAENLPDNWNEAIDYTDRYIKAIRNYLTHEGISVRSDLNSIEKIAKDIAKHLHDSPSMRQIEAIRYYLKHDLRNPKRNIVSQNTPKKFKNKSKKSSKSLAKLKTVNDKVVEEQDKSKRPSKSFKKSKTMNDKIVEKQESINVLKKNDGSLTARESVQEAQYFVEISNERNSINDEIMETPLQFEYIETEVVVDDLLETTEQGYQLTVDTDIFNDDKNATPEFSLSNSYNTVEVDNYYEAENYEKTGEIEQISETDTANSSPTVLTNRNDDKYPNHNFNLKRKSSNPIENNDYCSSKKQLQLYCRIPHKIHQVQNVIQSQAVPTRSMSDNSSHSEMNVDYDGDESEVQNSTFLMMNRFAVENESEEKTSFDSESSKKLQKSMFDLKSQAKNMSYTTAVKYIDLVTTFCEIENVISQEELLTMQEIRIKLYSKT